MIKHLYIHIPFCKSFCSYCDFCRENYNKKIVDEYIRLIKNDLDQRFKNNKFKTIYIGGGTPNCLDEDQLDFLLSILKKHLEWNYELTVECNPEFITQKQCDIFKKNNVNRISLGVQTFDENILKDINRKHSKNDVLQSIKLLQNSGINNLSCDLIYGFNNLSINTIKQTIDNLIKLDIKHLSLYSLELKENSLLTKNKYQLDSDLIDGHLSFIISYLDAHGWIRYEVSNWSKSDEYFSKHNLAYWNTSDWAAIGYGSYGFENKTYYWYDGKILEWNNNIKKYTSKEFYEQILIMGLRMTNGLDLTIHQNQMAFKHFKEQISNSKIIKTLGNKLICTNINLLDEFLITII